MNPRVLTVALVACGASKLVEPARARDLYTGDLFRKSRAVAERTADRWYVLSALHGLVHPYQRIEPYNQQMTGVRSEAEHWALLVDSHLRTDRADLQGAGEPRHGVAIGQRSYQHRNMSLGSWVMAGGEVDIVLLAGDAYCRYLVPRLSYWAATVTRPLAGLGIGEQKAALARMLMLAGAT